MVWVGLYVVSPTSIFIVEIIPVLMPHESYKLNNKSTIVVFPLVPVTPIKFNFLEGFS